ncbi:MAG: prepilin-type N-terminal cleavage/methylation domain-containing protein [Thermoanaerobaculia bacterium]
MRDERGFSLVEIMAAFLILTFVITTSLWAFLERNKRLQQASEIILAYQALANEAEFRRRVDFDALDGQPAIFDPSNLALLAPLEPFDAEVKVNDVKPGLVKNVTMTVRWKNGQREARLAIVRVQTGGGALF